MKDTLNHFLNNVGMRVIKVLGDSQESEQEWNISTLGLHIRSSYAHTNSVVRELSHKNLVVISPRGRSHFLSLSRSGYKAYIYYSGLCRIIRGGEE